MNSLPVRVHAGTLLAISLCLATSADVQGAVLRVPTEHPTLQAAIDAAISGDEIRLATGNHQQSAKIRGKRLLIIGETNAVLRAWPDLNVQEPGFLLEVGVGSHLTVRNIKFDGGRAAEAHPNNLLVGLAFHGGSGVVEDCVFEGFRGTNRLGSLWSSGTYAGCPDDYEGPPIHVVIRNNQYRDNAVSIYLTGSFNNSDPAVLRTTFAIVDNVIEGIGATALDFQLGMTINPGTSGLVKGNRVSEHFRSDPNQRWSSACVMTWEQYQIPHHPVRFEGNNFIRNQQALVMSEGDRAEIVGNLIEGRGRNVAHHGIVMTGQGVVLAGNSFSKMSRGIYLAGDTGLGSVDTVLLGNRFCDVGTPLFSDPNVSGTLNVGELDCDPVSSGAAPIETSPAAAEAGETVAIAGSELSTVRQVLFNGTPAEFTYRTDPLGVTTLEAIVPLRARDGVITVVRDTTSSSITNLFSRLRSLSVTRTPSEPMTLSWPAGSEDFLVESSSDLRQGWRPVLLSPTQTNDTYRLKVDGVGDAGFFRLHRK